MTAIIEINAIRLDNEPPMLDSLSNITEDERNYGVSTVGWTGYWNYKMGKQNTARVTGNFGLGIKNERGYTMVDFCSRNGLVVMNTMLKQHARRLYIWK